MHLDPKDYTKLIIKAYQEKRDANLLSHLLIDPSTASIRQECLNVYTEKIRKGEQVEEITLRSFFKVLPPGKSFGNVIEKYELDKFRPLQSLINGKRKNPTLANVELLAWLIDFTPRPLSRAQKAFENPYTREGLIIQKVDSIKDKSKPDQIDTNATGTKEVPTPTNTVNTKNLLEIEGRQNSVTDNEEAGKSTNDLRSKPPKKRIKIAAIIGLIIATFLSGVYIIQQQNCMCWADDHYEQVSCNEKLKGLIIPLDKEKMKNFKRITKEDTIKEKSIGMLYYLKTDNKPEYFTMGGTHPVYINRTLKILSRYIFEKYILKKETTDIDSLGEPNTKLTTNR